MFTGWPPRAMCCAGGQLAETPLIKGQPAEAANQRRQQQRRQQEGEEREAERRPQQQDQQPVMAVDARRWQGPQPALQARFQQQLGCDGPQQEQQGAQQQQAGAEAHAPQRVHHGRAPAADYLPNFPGPGPAAEQRQGAGGAPSDGQAQEAAADSPNPFLNGATGFTSAGPFSNQPADKAAAAAAAVAAADAIDSMPPVRTVHHHRTDSLAAVAPDHPPESPFDIPQLTLPAAPVSGRPCWCCGERLRLATAQLQEKT